MSTSEKKQNDLSKSGKKNVIVTVPHSYQVPSSLWDLDDMKQRYGPHSYWHGTDFTSWSNAMMFKQTTDPSLMNITMFKADQPRDEYKYKKPIKTLDLNRDRAISSSWRKRVTQKEHQIKNSESWLWDIHSFPPDHHPYGNGEHKNPEVVFLDNYPGTSFHDDTKSLVQALLNKNVKVNIFKGIPSENSITEEAIQNGIKHVFLIEWNESLSSSRRKQIHKWIVEWMNKRG